MLSTKFSCERTLWKKDLTRFWPLWAAYTVYWFLLLPMNLFGQAQSLARSYAALGRSGWAGDLAMQQVTFLSGAVAALGYGVLCAMAVWSYLFNARSVNLTHALPVRREGQFAAHYLSGVTLFLLPHGIIFVLTALAGAATGSRGDLGWIAAAMGVQTLLCLFFFSLATLCAFVTGHILALPALYVVANFLAYGLATLLDWLFGRFLFGVTSTLTNAPLVKWLYPMLNLVSSLGYRIDFEGGGTSGFATIMTGIPTPENGFDGPVTLTRYMEGLPVVLVYTAAALVFTALALLLYRRRHLETAGDVIAVGWLRPVFQYGVAFCAALTGAWILEDILGMRSPALIAVLLVVWGVIGCFAARMLLQKTLKVFKSGWKGAAATAAALLVLCAGLWTDALGLERKLPAAGEVESIWLRGPYSVPADSGGRPSEDVTDPALIEKIIALHGTVIDHREEQKALQSGEARRQQPDLWYTTFRVNYSLKNGALLEREYDLAVDLARADDPDSIAGAIKTLISDRDFVRSVYSLDNVDPGRFTEVLAEGLSDGTQGLSVNFFTPLSDYALDENADPHPQEGKYFDGPAAEQTDTKDGPDLRPVDTAELTKLWNAVLADFDAGNLGNRWLSWSDEGIQENVCSAALEFYWRQKAGDPERDYYYTEAVTIQLDRRAENTLRVLEELGLFENGAFISNYKDERVWPR